MKAGWQTKPLGEICKTGSGGTPLKSKKEYYENGTIPWLMSGEVSQGEVHVATRFITPKGLENSSARIFPVDTVLVAMYGATAGQVGILKFEASTNQAVCGILPNEHFTPEFLYYLFLSKKDELISQATGNAQPNISQIKIKNTQVPVLKLTEQQRIVAILDQAFDGIAKARANAEQNLKNARALFESHLQSVFTERGDGWTEKPLEQVSTVISGYSFKSADFSSSHQIKTIKITNVGVKEFVTDFDNLLPSGFKSKYEAFSVKKGSIVIALTRTIIQSGLKVAVVPSTYNGALLNQRVAAIVADHNYVIESYVYLYLSTKQVEQYVKNNVNTLMQPNLSINDLKALPIPLPTIFEQKKLVETLEALSKETKRLETLYQRKITLLDELKKSLLQQAFAGEL